jgi:hypothetical protein
VLIDSWEEEPGRDLVRILATILVERESQRAIVIGREGGMIKTISTEARQDLEEMLGRKVFLRANVVCEPRWRESSGILDLLDRAAFAVDLEDVGESDGEEAVDGANVAAPGADRAVADRLDDDDAGP